jgi:hypothetical protein
MKYCLFVSTSPWIFSGDRDVTRAGWDEAGRESAPEGGDSFGI